MASISSARKGRKQHDRSDDFIQISGDFHKIVVEWEETQPDPHVAYGRRLDEEKYELTLDCLSSPYRPDELEPLPMTNLVCEPSQYRRGEVEVYRLMLTAESDRTAIVDRHIFIDQDATDVNLVTCRDASEDEIKTALKWEAPPPPPKPVPVPPKPIYSVISRTDDPTSSRLGFQAGATEQRPIVVVPNRWHILAFNLSSPQIVGHLRVSLDLSRFTDRSLDLKIFDAFGTCLLGTTMHSDSVRLDQARLPAGDLLIAYRAPRGAEGHGSYDPRFSRILDGELPAAPQLDELILEPRPDGDPAKCGVPRFKFSAK